MAVGCLLFGHCSLFVAGCLLLACLSVCLLLVVVGCRAVGFEVVGCCLLFVGCWDFRVKGLQTEG